MVRSQALATVHRMNQLTLSCLAMAPSIMSQWNQRKLAPNYRPLSVKTLTGAGGVCQRVEAGWLTHCGDWGRYYTQRTSEHMHRAWRTQVMTHICTGTHTGIRLKLPSFWLIWATAGSAPPTLLGCHNRNHLCSISDPTGLITHTMEADASGFYAPQAPLCWGWSS